MSKREKIILLIMFLTIIYGGYNFFIAPSVHKENNSPSAPRQSMPITNLVSEIGGKLNKEQPTETERLLLDLAGKRWTKDPFLASASGLSAQKASLPEKADDAPAKDSPNWTYSGYLELGSKRLAVINGIEYEEGEGLLADGYFVKRIYTNRVIVGVFGKNDAVTLPLNESETGMGGQTR
jgi:hypothetical protein